MCNIRNSGMNLFYGDPWMSHNLHKRHVTDATNNISTNYNTNLDESSNILFQNRSNKIGTSTNNKQVKK